MGVIFYGSWGAISGLTRYAGHTRMVKRFFVSVHFLSFHAHLLAY